MSVQIYLINQNVDLIRLAEHAGRKRSDKIVFCCTQALFPHEWATVADLLGNRLEVVEWADLISDADAQSCDDRASSALAPRLAEAGFREHYPGYHMEASGRLKNALIHGELQHRYPQAAYHHSAGLGIVEGYWREQGSRELPSVVHNPPPTDAKDPSGLISGRLEILTAQLPDHACIYVFVTDTGRLHFHPDVALATNSIEQGLDDLLASGKPWEKLLEAIGMDGGSVVDLRLATTIHGYRGQLLKFHRPLHVIVDGYHPPNYPRTYIDLYDPAVIIEAREPITCEWFWRHNRSCGINSDLLAAVCFQTPEARFEKRRPVILFALNHAGDWSALINRSDTDRLVMAATEAATALPQADIVIRPHPTMDQLAHEGWRSRNRIDALVEGCQRVNLTVSQASLEVDLDRADIVVSEYSQVLIDAIVSGRIGIAVNLTRRRSFMATYQSMGLQEATSVEALVAALYAAIVSPEQTTAAQKTLCTHHGMLKAAVVLRCPVCNSLTIGWIGRRGGFEDSNVFICYGCNHYFLSPEPTDAQLEAFYRDVYDPNRNGYLGSWYLNFMVERADAQYRFVTEGLAAVWGPKGCCSRRVVDIGCGVGALTERFRISGADARGFDADGTVIAFGRQQFPEANIRERQFQEFADEPVDLLLMSHVVEHMTNLRSRLAALKSQVAADGFIFFEVPNTEPAMFDAAPEPDGHIHFFTATSLRRLAEELGLTVVACRSCGATFSQQKEAVAKGNAEDIYTSGHQTLRPEGDHTGIWLRCLVRMGNVPNPSRGGRI